MVEDTHLAGDDLRRPWWAKEDPGEERDVGAKTFSLDEVFTRFDAIERVVATLAIASWNCCMQEGWR